MSAPAPSPYNEEPRVSLTPKPLGEMTDEELQAWVQEQKKLRTDFHLAQQLKPKTRAKSAEPKKDSKYKESVAGLFADDGETV